MEVVLEHWTGSRKALHTLLDGLEDIGSLLPGPVRGAVQRYVQRSLRAIA
jgi:hypothetical protein